MNDCIFCRIASKEIPAQLLRETERVLAFNDINPSAPVHILIVPKKHIPTFLDIQQEDAALLGEMTKVAQELIVEGGLQKDSYRMIFNGGTAQHVPHLHWHLISNGHLP